LFEQTGSSGLAAESAGRPDDRTTGRAEEEVKRSVVKLRGEKRSEVAKMAPALKLAKSRALAIGNQEAAADYGRL